jgi:aspartate-semialdehyde dehydrogenase
MSKQLVGLVGWRGMVGSVLMDRMQAEGDFALIEPVFFSTSNAGGKARPWPPCTPS